MGLMACFLALTAEGDEILYASPGYGYGSQAKLAGATAVEVPVAANTDFVMMPEQVEAKITSRTKILCHCSPLNPSGSVTPPEVVAALAELAIKYNLLVVADEICGCSQYYCSRLTIFWLLHALSWAAHNQCVQNYPCRSDSDMIFGPHPHLSIADCPGMKERTVLLRGCSKSYAMTGCAWLWHFGALARLQKLSAPLSTFRNACHVQMADRVSRRPARLRGDRVHGGRADGAVGFSCVADRSDGSVLRPTRCCP